MTVSAQVKQTLAGLKGAQAALESFATISETLEAKETIRRNSQKVADVIKDLEKRLGVLEFEEPQYKGF